ncbi:MAG: hypothetical protein HKN01_07770 [Acidimicrobiia bacterium]|nr:hypothetical protein [Acidimicrobiia bacterium]
MAESTLELVVRNDIQPVCPHCEKELAMVFTRGRGFPLFQGRNNVFFCPECHKVLGFAQGRMA